MICAQFSIIAPDLWRPSGPDWPATSSLSGTAMAGTSISGLDDHFEMKAVARALAPQVEADASEKCRLFSGITWVQSCSNSGQISLARAKLLYHHRENDTVKGGQSLEAACNLLVPDRLAPSRFSCLKSCARFEPRVLLSHLDLGSALRVPRSGWPQSMAILVRRCLKRSCPY